MDSEVDFRRIGRHFRAARQQLNLKQKGVADLIGVSTKTYSNMERGAQAPNLRRIVQICRLLKKTPGCVLNDCNDEFLTTTKSDLQSEGTADAPEQQMFR